MELAHTPATDQAHAQPGADRACNATQPRELTEQARPSLATPRSIAWLQRTAGNQAVARLVRRQIQRASDAEKIDKALKADPPDASLVKDIDNFSTTPDNKVKLAHILVYNYSTFFGPNDRKTLTNILESFSAEVGYVAKKDPFLFEKCLKEWPGLMMSIPAIDVSAKSFKNMIGAEAKQNLDANVKYLEDQHQQLWGSKSSDSKQILDRSNEENARALAMTKMAGELLRIRRGQQKMLDTVVGFKYVHNLGSGVEQVKFAPGHAPGADYYEHEKGAKYADLQSQWAVANAEMGNDASQFPWLYGILKDPDNADARLESLSKITNPYEARAQIQGEMQKQIHLAKDVQAQYSSSPPDWFDLVPVRDRILGGDKLETFDLLVARAAVQGRKDADWYKKVGFQVLSGAAIVVATLATAGAAPMIAGILAGVVATGVPAAQAYMKYQSSEELGKLNRATVLPETDMVSAMQVSAARAEAVAHAIEAVLTLILMGKDLTPAVLLESRLVRLATLAANEQAEVVAAAIKQFGPVNTSAKTGMPLSELLVKAGQNGDAVAAINKEMAELAKKPLAELTVEQRNAMRFASAGDAGLLNLDTLGVPERVAAVTKAMDRQGVAATVRASGRSADELMTIVGKDTPAGQRIAAYIAETRGGVGAAMDDLIPRLAKLGELSADDANKLIQQAFDLAGPARTLQRAGGWAAVETKLGPGASAMGRLNSWRDGVMKQLDQFANGRTAADGVVSAAELDAQRAFLASQAGVEAAEVERVIGGSVADAQFMKRHAPPVPFDTRLIGTGDDKLAKAGRWLRPESGKYDVLVHGSPDSFWIYERTPGPGGYYVGPGSSEKWTQINHRQLAAYMKKTGWKGQPVRLVACNTGESGAVRPVAQDLANKLGVEVTAPTEKVWVHADGSTVVSNLDPPVSGIHQSTGTWADFVPRKP